MDDPIRELDEFAAQVELSKLAQDRPDPLTPEYVTRWARGCANAAAIGQRLLEGLHDELSDRRRQSAMRAGFGEIVNAIENLRMELEDIISGISDGDQDYTALASEYLEGKDAMDFVVNTVVAFYKAIGSPRPRALKRIPAGRKLLTILRGTRGLQLWINDLGWMIDELWGPDDEPNGDGEPGDGGSSEFTEPGEPWHDENPTVSLVVPAGSNPLVFALDEAKAANTGKTFTADDVIHVYTQPYDGPGLAVGATGWTPGIGYEPWWGEATLVLHGTGEDSSIIQPNGGGGWGTSWSVYPHSGWKGRMVVVGFKIICSGANAIGGGLYGSQTRNPLHFIRFVECAIVDGIERCTRPISINQTSIKLIRCKWRCPDSKEHGCYSRNPFGPGGMEDCDMDGIGGQIWQEVARPSEGPTYEHDETVIEGGVFRNYHQDPGRAGSGVTQAGSGRTFRVRGALFLDIERDAADPPRSGLQSFGAHTSWTGGPFRPLPGGFANEACYYEDVDIVHKDGGRALLTFNATRTVRAKNCGFWGRSLAIASNLDGDALIGDLRVEGCNTDAIRQRVLDREPAIDPALLVDPKITLGHDKNKWDTGLVVSQGVKVKDGKIAV